MNWRDRTDARFERWGRFVVQHHWLVLALAAAYLFWMGTLIPQLRFENSSLSYLHDDDPASVRYEAFCDQFGQDDQIIIALSPTNVFDPHFLETLRDLHAALEDELPYVTEVNSLVNARRTRGEGDMLIIEELLSDWPSTTAGFQALRERVLSNPLYVDSLISSDGRTTTITIEPDVYESDDDDDAVDLIAGFEHDEVARQEGRSSFLTSESKAELLEELHGVLARFEQADVEVRLTGGPVISHHTNVMTAKDIKAFMLVSAGAIVFFLFLLFRRASGILLPIVVVTASLVSVLGTMVWLDIPLSLVAGMLPIFTMTVCVCTAVHVLVVVYREIDLGHSFEDSVGEAMRHSGLAIAMASATTAAGLCSFVSAELGPIAQLGLIAPFAVLYAFVFTVTLVPALLAIRPPRLRARRGKSVTPPITERVMVFVGGFSGDHAVPVLLAGGALVVFLTFGLVQLRFSHQPVAWFPASDPARAAIEFVDRMMRGSTNLEVVIDTGRENGLHEPEVLRRIEAAMEMAEALSVDQIFIGKALSLVDIVKESHEALSGGDPNARVIPNSRAVVSQELLLFENGGSDDLEKFTDSQFRLARLSLRLPQADAVDYQRFLEKLTVGLDATLGELEYEVTGNTDLAARAMAGLITSMGTSYAIALLIITPLMMLMIGDPRLGLISMVPNLLPVLFVLGVMGWLDISLDASSIMIGSIVIGLAVDDTIHFMQSFRREAEHNGDDRAAIRETMRVTGSALFFTSLVLSTGFIVMALRASMINTVRFGALSAAGIGFAFVADVIFTPALIIVVRRYARRRKTL
ncbi:MAG: putative RND superfamily exporter protein [Myxococcota bacterium]|jgi:predicted RND superfamily exporter protein